jgi:hypothetical protein
MAKRTTKKKQPDHPQLARKVLDTIVPQSTDNKSAKNPAAVQLHPLRAT